MSWKSIVRSAYLGAFIMGVLSPVSSMAQTTSPSAPKEEPTIKEEMKLSTEKDVGYGADTSFLTWHGYLSLEGHKKQQAVGTFDLHELYLSAKAQIAPKISVTAEFEYEHAAEVLVLPMQAYVDYVFNPALVVRGGMFFAPVGIPRTFTLRGNKNRLIRQNAMTHDLAFENWADVGVDVFGQFKNGLFYDVAVGNGMPNTMGTGDSWFDGVDTLKNHTEDNNNNKALMSRFGYDTTTSFGNFNVAASYATQEYDPAQTLELTHVGVDARYVHRSGLRFQGEYLRRSGDDNPVDLAKGIAADGEGWYAQFSKRTLFNERKSYFEPVFQVDAIDLNSHVDANNDLLTTAVGLNLSPAEHYLLKFEYDFVDERHGASIRNNKVWFGMVAEF